MRSKGQPLVKPSELTSLIDGNDLSEMVKVWRETARSEARLNLLARLRDINVGFNEVQKFGLGLRYCLKSEKLQDKGNKPILRVVQAAMDLKRKDETFLLAENKKKRENWKRRIGRIHPQRSERYKRIIKYLRQEAAAEKEEQENKHKNKIRSLEDKYRESEEEKLTPPQVWKL